MRKKAPARQEVLRHCVVSCWRQREYCHNLNELETAFQYHSPNIKLFFNANFVFWLQAMFWWLHTSVIAKTARSKGRERSMATSHEGPITRQNPIVEAGVMAGCEMQMQQRIKSYLDSLKDLTGGLAFFFSTINHKSNTACFTLLLKFIKTCVSIDYLPFKRHFQ